MQEYFYNDAGQDVSLENISNYFWSLPSINIYTATVPDRMHHLDLGLFHYQIKFTQTLLQKQDSSLVGKIDDRLSKIPRFQKFLMKVMIFMVDNLYEENKNNVENRKLSEVYAKWNKMYIMSRSEIFTKSDLENFQFGAINGYTTETYKSLHKDFVKISYRMSNKKNVEDQIMKTVS
ncbi:hypothetical protein Glove_547g39 [Diversispora epigaea]|uniref:Uncharacterized protein n=1 Tax=Diversispora epigaea TaxID=1348612 RepID=A0A397GHP2_9GLOM|nr:hypothetical protein Glove_547g39 [Diversispora epigaea]